MVVPSSDALRQIADHIDTGSADPDTSRALVVFNLTDRPLSGTAVFHASMSWPTGTPLPPVAVMEMGGTRVASAVTDMMEGPDRKGRVDRRQLSFSLRFAVFNVPAQGWKAYIAAYVSEPVPGPFGELTEKAGLRVVETTRHGGDLPPVGTFADLSAVSVVQ